MIKFDTARRRVYPWGMARARGDGENPLRKINIRIPREVHEYAERIAAQKGDVAASVLRDFLARGMRQYQGLEKRGQA